MDFGISFAADVAAGKGEIGIDGTYILKYGSQAVPAAPTISLVDTPYNPASLRLRGRVGFVSGHWNFAGFVNHVGSYVDSRQAIAVPVRSWTTGDMTVRYNFGARDSFLSGASISLSVLNITNEPPPFVVNAFPAVWVGINFDGTNANARGRFISIQLAKHW
jgi:iron complex outermembrane receptor protein